MSSPQIKYAILHSLQNCQSVLAVAVVGLRIDTVSVAIGPSHVAAATILVVATAGADKQILSIVALSTHMVDLVEGPLLGIVYRHGIAGRVVPRALEKSCLAERSVPYPVCISAWQVDGMKNTH